MQTSIVRIGNSRGIRLPKAIIEQCGFQETVELEVRDGALILRPVSNPREGWEAALAELVGRGDELLDPDAISNPTEWESEAWEW